MKHIPVRHIRIISRDGKNMIEFDRWTDAEHVKKGKPYPIANITRTSLKRLNALLETADSRGTYLRRDSQNHIYVFYL